MHRTGKPVLESSLKSALTKRVDVEAQRQQPEDRPTQAPIANGEEEHDGVKGTASQEDDLKHQDAR